MWYLIVEIFMASINLSMNQDMKKTLDHKILNPNLLELKISDQRNFNKNALQDGTIPLITANLAHKFHLSLSEKSKNLLATIKPDILPHNQSVSLSTSQNIALTTHFDRTEPQSKLTRGEKKKLEREVISVGSWKKEKSDNSSFRNSASYETNDKISDKTIFLSDSKQIHKNRNMTDTHKPVGPLRNQERTKPINTWSKNLNLKNDTPPGDGHKNHPVVIPYNAFSKQLKTTPFVGADFKKLNPYSFDLDRWGTLWNWEGYYEVEDLTPLSGRSLSRRNLFLTDTDSDLGLIASLYDEELSCRIFSHLFYFEPDKMLASDQPLGYQPRGRLELKPSETAENLLGAIKNTPDGDDYLFKATKILDAPRDAETPCSLADLKGDYTGFVGDIPGIINIELTVENKPEVKFTSARYGSISTEIESSYRPSSGRLFMINKKTSYPFIWRLIAESDDRAPCSLAGFAFSTFNSQLRPATFKRITP